MPILFRFHVKTCLRQPFELLGAHPLVVRGASPHKLLKAMLMVVLLVGASVAASGATVDGFTVNVQPNPMKGVLPTPNPVTNGGVYYLVGGHSYPPGVDAFYKIKKLAGVTPYLSIQSGASVTFKFKNPASSFTVLWASPDPQNQISFFDASNNQVGQTLEGADITSMFGTGYQFYFTVTSSTPFSSAVMTETSACCFEFSNVSAQ